MTAADRRAELEAAIRREATYCHPNTGRYTSAISERGLADVLYAADVYATAFAADQREGQARLAEAAAEAGGKA